VTFPTSAAASPQNGPENPQLRSYLALFREATLAERLALLIAVVCAAVHGASWPVWSLLFGQAISRFDMSQTNSLTAEIRELSVLFVYVGLVIGLCAAVHVFVFNFLGAQLEARLRFRFLQAVRAG
jgi:ATP-binding cassette subfamily B (MDR/TAP) protein 1